MFFLGRQHKSALDKHTDMDLLPSEAEASGSKHVTCDAPPPPWGETRIATLCKDIWELKLKMLPSLREP